jgi:hypothetical protein
MPLTSGGMGQYQPVPRELIHFPFSISHLLLVRPDETSHLKSF